VTDSTATEPTPGSAATSGETLTVRDNRTGQEYEVPILDGAIKAADMGKSG
jgi:citrate synthase